MAKNINHLQHVKSNVVEENLPKLPQPSVLVEGEIAVNYAADYETLSIKNSSGEVVTFSSDNYYTEKKLGSGFTGDNSGYTVTEAINDTELVMAAALNDLNQRKMDISAYTPVEMEYYHENGDDYLGAITVETDDGSSFDGITPQGNVTLQASGSGGAIGAVNVGPGQTIISAGNNGQGDVTIVSDGSVAMGRINNSNVDRIIGVHSDGAIMSATNTESGITSTLLVAESGVSVTTESGNIFTYNGVEVATVNDIPELEFDSIPTSGSPNAVSSSGLYETFRENEITISMALNDLNERKLDESAYTPTDLSDYYTSDEVDMLLSDKADVQHTHAISDVTNLQTTLNQKVSAVTLNNSTKTPTNGVVNLGTVISSLTLNSSAQTVTNGTVALNITANYDSNTKKLYLKNNNAVMSEIDATDFIKDGMVDDVIVDVPVSGENSGNTCLIITFNTDAGKEDIEIPLSDMFDSDLFYTKEEVNTMLGSGFTEDIDEPGFKSVEDTIYDMTVATSAALNDLNSRKLDASAYTPVELEYYHENETVSGTPIVAGTLVTNENGDVFLNVIANGGNGDVVTIAANNPQELKNSGVMVSPDAMHLISQSNDGDASIEMSSGSIYAYGDSVEVETSDSIILKTGEPDSNFTSLVSDRTAISLSAFTYDQLGYDVNQSITLDIDSGVSVSATSFTYNGKEVATIDDIYTKQEIDNAFGSGFTVSAITSSITDVIRENEVIIAAALNDLEAKKLDASAYTPTDLSDYATKQWVNEERLGSGFTGENSGNTVTSELDEMALVTSEAINDLNDRISGNTTFINQVNAKTDNIARSLSGYTPSGYSYSKGEVEVKLSDKLDASAYTPTDLSNYYTKTEVDDKLGSGFTGENSGLTVTKAMNDTERAVAAALNDLNSRIIDLEDDKQDVLVSGVNIKTINNESILGTGNIIIEGGGGGGDIMSSVTYSDLVGAVSASGLTPGAFYRITDYATTTTQQDTSAASHVFDVVVQALDDHTLSENAQAIQHSGDTYFSSSTLSAWELKYCLDNDTDRFAWADSTNGKGVIYYMKDEYNNECPYDFKNIMFKRQDTNSNNIWCYTFSFYYDNSSNNIIDASIFGNDGTLLNDDNSISGVYGNVIKPYFEYTYETPSTNPMLLNKIVFLSTESYEVGYYYGCRSNTFGENCYHNTFGNSCYSNTFGDDCYDNTFGNSCYHNTFGNSCYSNTFGTSSTLKNYYRYIIVDNGNQNIYLNNTQTLSSSNYCQNIHIAQGVNNSNTYKTITHTTVNDTFQTTYQAANSQIVNV